jgi:hypothetical protein
MASGDELRKSFASDAAAYAMGIATRQVSSADADALASVITEKKKARPTATRSAVTAADAAGDISGNSSSAVDLANSMHCAVFCEGTPTSATITVFLALFDESNAMVGKTEAYTFALDGSYRNGSTDYFSDAYVFDTRGAAKAYPVVSGITGTSRSINVFVKPL